MCENSLLKKTWQKQKLDQVIIEVPAVGNQSVKNVGQSSTLIF